MKSVLISIQPYWVFLIIAKKMGWNIDNEKTVEVRKNYPKDENWDKVAKIYCSKDKKSFAKIPKEYQPFMEKFLGKVVGEFVCKKIDRMVHCGTCNSNIRLRIVDENRNYKELDSTYLSKCKLHYNEIDEYSSGGDVYGWHISNLVIYDNLKELSEFHSYNCGTYIENGYPLPTHEIKRPPQSWCYVESEVTE